MGAVQGQRTRRREPPPRADLRHEEGGVVGVMEHQIERHPRQGAPHAMLTQWHVFQVLQGWSALLMPYAASNIAWWAHIGGFLAGVALLCISAARAA